MKLNKSSEPGFHCLYVYAILLNHLYGLYLLCPRSFFSSVKISWRYFSKLPNLKICPAYQPPPKVEEREESEGERKILYEGGATWDYIRSEFCSRQPITG